MITKGWKRPDDWPELLDQYVIFHAQMPMEWGYNDCVQFAWGWLHTINHPVSKLISEDIPPYFTAQQAVTLIAELSKTDPDPTFANLAGLTSQYMGAAYDNTKRISRGDLGLVLMGSRMCLGICVGVDIIGPGKEGLMTANIERAVKAWKV